ncbi:MAG TPA: YbhB/YbcL family Raf kinase inhibitor-like protein [Thermoguttaceae bacterium]|nr:YbhB/YbcL family Raf kinase inhibitor-like protein [Thermoguttaceae bacterium]HPP52237.1 YbhB/YbcL family Raf kinase inhibitor-like protein [Thermoguttaceae bacterium]
MAMQLSSSAFVPGGAIPRRYTGEGEDISPPLQWTAVPAGTQELALICDDPDAPTPEPLVHWVLYKIPPQITALPEGLPKTSQLSQPPGAMQGKNSWASGQTIGYRGPMPPPGHGVHHYHFTLYALDSPLNIQPGETKKNLLKKMEGHILATAELIGTYQR